MKTLAWIALVLCGALLLAGCGGSSSKKDGGKPAGGDPSPVKVEMPSDTKSPDTKSPDTKSPNTQPAATDPSGAKTEPGATSGSGKLGGALGKAFRKGIASGEKKE
jgi:hypothetical protein